MRDFKDGDFVRSKATGELWHINGIFGKTAELWPRNQGYWYKGMWVPSTRPTVDLLSDYVLVSEEENEMLKAREAANA